MHCHGVIVRQPGSDTYLLRAPHRRCGELCTHDAESRVVSFGLRSGLTSCSPSETSARWAARCAAEQPSSRAVTFVHTLAEDHIRVLKMVFRVPQRDVIARKWAATVPCRRGRCVVAWWRGAISHTGRPKRLCQRHNNGMCTEQ